MLKGDTLKVLNKDYYYLCSYNKKKYFTDIDNLPLWIGYLCIDKYIAPVDFLDEEIINCNERNIYDTKKLIIKERVLIEDLKCWDDNDFCIKAINQNPCSIKFIKNPSKNLCELAVSKNGYVIQFINQDETNYDLCKIAVSKNGDSLKYIKNKTKELCMLAVSNDGYALKHIEDQNEELCCLAVKNYGPSLKFVKNQTDKICEIAVKSEGLSLQYVLNKTKYLCDLAIMNTNYAGVVRYVENPSIEFYEKSIKLLPLSDDFFRDKNIIEYKKEKEQSKKLKKIEVNNS